MMRRDEKVNASERIVMSSEYWNSLDLAQVDTGIVTHDFSRKENTQSRKSIFLYVPN